MAALAFATRPAVLWAIVLAALGLVFTAYRHEAAQVAALNEQLATSTSTAGRLQANLNAMEAEGEARTTAAKAALTRAQATRATAERKLAAYAAQPVASTCPDAITELATALWATQ